MSTDRSRIDGGLPVRKGFLPLAYPLLGTEEEQEVLHTLRSNWLSRGPKAQRFEMDLKAYIGCDYAHVVSSCTAGLHIALVANGIGEGDEVITCPQTFVATANVILYERATPVFVDCDRRTFNIDVEQIEDKITSRTRAIMPIHMAGQPCDLEPILDIAKRHRLIVIEDAAHAIGAVYKGRKIGTWSDHAAFSFYATKNMTTGDGGMVTSRSKEMDTKLRVLSLHGMSADAWRRYDKDGKPHWTLVYPGFKYNMTDIEAAIGIHQLDRLEGFIGKRERIAKQYTDAFSEIPEVGVPHIASDRRHIWHLYILTLDIDALGVSQNGFVDLLKSENIGAGIHYTSVHLQPYYQDKFGFKPEDFPNARWLSERVVSLPMFPAMTEQDVNDVIVAVRKVVDYCREREL
jgi:dTDP-4-amino-4,6-dideoxygalactose transaminase